METQSASVEIALKPSVGKTLPNNIQAIIQNEYASRYLESIGANPSKENMDLMLKSLPLKEALILPVWQREAIVIMPGVAKNADINAIMHQLVNSNLEKARGETDGGGTAAEEDTAKKKSPKKLDFSPRKKVNTKEVAFKHVDITHPKKENHARDNRKLSWCTVNTPDVLDDFVDRISVRDAATNHFKNLLLPMGLIKTQILQSVHCFNLSLDGFLLETNVNNKRVLELNVQSLLGSSSCIRLYDILIRFCYWSIIHPTARKVIIAAKKEDPSCFPEHIMTTANAKRESMAYLRHEIYLKKKKEQELLASREKVESLEEEGTLNSGRDRTHSHEMDEGGVGTDAEVGFDGAVEPMDSMIQISEDGFGLDQPDSAVTAELSATASETSLDMQEREELFLQLEKCRHIIHREVCLLKHHTLTDCGL